MADLNPSITNVLCLVLDRWHAGYLGAYGNAWLGTPELDRFAAESLVAERMLIDSPAIDSLYASWWLGCHHLASPKLREGWQGLPERLAGAGIETVLWTDEPEVARHPLARFDDCLTLPRGDGDTAPASDPADTELARGLAAVSGELGTLREPFFGWVHLGSLGRAWDAPLEFRRRLVEGDESLPPDDTRPPRLLWPADNDPDELLGWRRAYAGQIQLTDLLLGTWLDDLEHQPWAARTAVLLCGARGLALGEHERLGAWDDLPQQALVHVPWLLRLPQRATRGVRGGALLQPADVAATLAAIHGLSPQDGPRWGASALALVDDLDRWPRDRALTVTYAWRAVRTRAWSLWLPRDESTQQAPRLYAKPDDRWEVNDVADRCPEIVARLSALGDELASAAAADDPTRLSPLADELVETWR